MDREDFDRDASYQHGDFIYAIADDLLSALLEDANGNHASGESYQKSASLLMLEDWLSLQVESKTATKRQHLSVNRRNKLRSKLEPDDFQVVSPLRVYSLISTQ